MRCGIEQVPYDYRWRIGQIRVANVAAFCANKGYKPFVDIFYYFALLQHPDGGFVMQGCSPLFHELGFEEQIPFYELKREGMTLTVQRVQ